MRTVKLFEDVRVGARGTGGTLVALVSEAFQEVLLGTFVVEIMISHALTLSHCDTLTVVIATIIILGGRGLIRAHNVILHEV